MSMGLPSIFQEMFGQIGSIVGHEANYQAALQCQLAKVLPDDVLREFVDRRTGSGGIDVVVRSARNSALLMAFEIKGGAYGDRNALTGTFDQDGYCTDFDRLLKLRSSKTECWMVAIDALELGRGISYKQKNRAMEHSKERGIGFVYYALGEDAATILDLKGNHHQLSVSKTQGGGIPYSEVRPLIIEQDLLFNGLQTYSRIYEKEADIVGDLYSLLCRVGFSPFQMSLETYFGFAPRSRMHQRPDLCLYEAPIHGRFNLYPKGNRALSNDKAKLENLRSMVEIKGSLTLNKSRDKTLMEKYIRDIDKLQNWQNHIKSAQAHYQIVDQAVDYIFIGVDHRKTKLSTDAEEELYGRALAAGVCAHYIYLPNQDPV